MGVISGTYDGEQNMDTDYGQGYIGADAAGGVFLHLSFSL